MLTNVTAAAAKDAAGAPSARSARTYRLIANETALAPHAGKKLEVTGTLDDQAGATGAAGSTAPASAAADAAPKLTVESGKIIAPNCTE